jgi:hypothetical protein
MTFEWWFAYLLTSIILSLSPGSGAINTMTPRSTTATAARRLDCRITNRAGDSYRPGWYRPGTLFSRSVLAFEVLKWAGAAYLIWLGIQQWRAADRSISIPWQRRKRGKTVPARGFRQPDQPEKHCLSGGPVPAVYRAASAAGDAVSGLGVTTLRSISS